MTDFLRKTVLFSGLVLFFMGGTPLCAMSKLHGIFAGLARRIIIPDRSKTATKVGTEFKLVEKDEDGSYRIWSRKKWTFTVTEQESGYPLSAKQIKREAQTDHDDNNVFYQRGTEKQAKLEDTSSFAEAPAGQANVVDVDFTVDGKEYKATEPVEQGVFSKILGAVKKRFAN